MIKPTDIATTQRGIEAYTIVMDHKSGPIDELIAALQAIAAQAESPEEKQEVGGTIESLIAQYQDEAAGLATLLD